MQSSTFETGFLNGRIVISFPESAAPAAERNDFITFLKMEWIARQSRFSGKDAKALAEEVDSTW
jgi:hypothetical protein